MMLNFRVIICFGLKEFITSLYDARMDITPGMEIFSSPTMASACNKITSIIYLLTKNCYCFVFKKVPAGKSEGETYAAIP